MSSRIAAHVASVNQAIIPPTTIAETGQFPLSIYRPWFRKFFIFVVPLGCVSYFPALAILGREDQAIGSPHWFQCSAPLIGVVFLLISLQVWKFGVRHYRSTGS